MSASIEPAVILLHEVDLLLHEVKRCVQNPDYLRGFLAGNYAVRSGAEVRGLTEGSRLERCFLEVELRRHDGYEASSTHTERELSKLREEHARVVAENANLRAQTKNATLKLDVAKQAHLELTTEHTKLLREVAVFRERFNR